MDIFIFFRRRKGHSKNVEQPKSIDSNDEIYTKADELECRVKTLFEKIDKELKKEANKNKVI